MIEFSAEPVRISATSIAPGDILAGKYRIDRLLGAGGMGVVLLATHLELDAQVAIKVVRDEFARNEEVVARMLFEARAVAKLKSSHVVRVLDVARLDSGAPYIVMERLEGSDLAQVLVEGGPMPVQEAVDYVLQACEGLVEAHALGIIHRDLKPENLYRASTREGSVVKVLDFGISKEIGVAGGTSLSPRSVMTSAGYAVGSPYYMSPEQMRAQEVDARADIWSLGAILYELISGRCPFEGESLPVVCASVLNDVEAAPLASLAAGVPQGLSAVVACCLQKKREERFETVQELVAALRVFASTEGQRSADRTSRPLLGGSDFHLKGDRSTATPPPMAATTGATMGAFRPASRRYAPVAGAVLAVACAAIAWVALRSPAEAPVAANPLISAAQPAAAVAPPEPAELTPTPVTITTAPMVRMAPSAEPTVARGAKRPSAGVATPPQASAAAAKPASVASPSAKPPADAWDPDRFGGRY